MRDALDTVAWVRKLAVETETANLAAQVRARRETQQVAVNCQREHDRCQAVHAAASESLGEAACAATMARRVAFSGVLSADEHSAGRKLTAARTELCRREQELACRRKQLQAAQARLQTILRLQNERRRDRRRRAEGFVDESAIESICRQHSVRTSNHA